MLEELYKQFALLEKQINSDQTYTIFIEDRF